MLVLFSALGFLRVVNVTSFMPALAAAKSASSPPMAPAGKCTLGVSWRSSRAPVLIKINSALEAVSLV